MIATVRYRDHYHRTAFGIQGLGKTMFLMWFDPDKRRATHLKVNDAMEVFREKFSEDPVRCLVNEVEATELATGKAAPPLPVQAAPYIPRNMFYVGDYDVPEVEDVPAPVQMAESPPGEPAPSAPPTKKPRRQSAQRANPQAAVVDSPLETPVKAPRRQAPKRSSWVAPAVESSPAEPKAPEQPAKKPARQSSKRTTPVAAATEKAPEIPAPVAKKPRRQSAQRPNPPTPVIELQPALPAPSVKKPRRQSSRRSTQRQSTAPR